MSLMTMGRGEVWMSDPSPPPSKAEAGAEAYSMGDLTLPSPDESRSSHFILRATLHLYGLAYTCSLGSGKHQGPQDHRAGIGVGARTCWGRWHWRVGLSKQVVSWTLDG